MTADQEIQQLGEQLTYHHDEFPNTYATLRITNTSFRAATKQQWEAQNWSVRDEEVAAILHGNAEERRAAFLSLLRPHHITQVEFISGMDIIAVVPNPKITATV